MSATGITNARFARFAWGLLAYSLLVILGGAFVRATVSGDGCGNHWPDCQGQLIPAFTEHKTGIEFAHRASTGILLPLVILLAVWAFRTFPRSHPARAGAVWVLGFTLFEAWIGAVLVKYGLVALDQSVQRAIVMPLHLVATFGLLMAGSLTAWWGSGGRRIHLTDQGPLPAALGLGLLAMLLLGVSGAITALGDTLFPAGSLEAGFHQDLSPEAHFLIGLRIYHPLIAISAGLYVALLAGLVMHLRPSIPVVRFSRIVVSLFMLQIGLGVLNLVLLAPVWMQLAHLLVADAVWISLVLVCASSLAEGVPQAELGTIAGATLSLDRATWRDYVALTKPRVISLLLLTTLAAMFIAAQGQIGPSPGLLAYLGVGLGLYMAAGAANAINMLLERDLDLRMGRTATRPTVTDSIPPRAALKFALSLAGGSFLLLWWAGNLLAAMLALAGLSFYVLVYTLLLKRRTALNIVIGGAAGAFPPLVGWAAARGDLNLFAWCLFAIIFLWTPVHFWALAILLKDDYARAGVPMLPVLLGERATAVRIVAYTLLTAAVSALPLVLPQSEGRLPVGWIYVVVAVVLNAVLLTQSVQLCRRPDRPRARALFHYSMIYLALLFVAMAVDSV